MPNVSEIESWSGIHDDRFSTIMNRHLRQWRALRATLNTAPLSHKNGSY